MSTPLHSFNDIARITNISKTRLLALADQNLIKTQELTLGKKSVMLVTVSPLEAAAIAIQNAERNQYTAKAKKLIPALCRENPDETRALASKYPKFADTVTTWANADKPAPQPVVNAAAPAVPQHVTQYTPTRYPAQTYRYNGTNIRYIGDEIHVNEYMLSALLDCSNLDYARMFRDVRTGHVFVSYPNTPEVHRVVQAFINDTPFEVRPVALTDSYHRFRTKIKHFI